MAEAQGELASAYQQIGTQVDAYSNASDITTPAYVIGCGLQQAGVASQAVLASDRNGAINAFINIGQGGSQACLSNQGGGLTNFLSTAASDASEASTPLDQAVQDSSGSTRKCLQKDLHQATDASTDLQLASPWVSAVSSDLYAIQSDTGSQALDIDTATLSQIQAALATVTGVLSNAKSDLATANIDFSAAVTAMTTPLSSCAGQRSANSTTSSAVEASPSGSSPSTSSTVSSYPGAPQAMLAAVSQSWSNTTGQPTAEVSITGEVDPHNPTWGLFSANPIQQTGPGADVSGEGIAHLEDGNWIVVIGATREPCDAYPNAAVPTKIFKDFHWAQTGGC